MKLTAVVFFLVTLCQCIFASSEQLTKEHSSISSSAFPLPRSKFLDSLVRQPRCRAPRAICPGQGCIRCREIGPAFLRLLISLRRSVNRPNFRQSLNRFIALVRPGGRADFAQRIYRNDCCLRIFGIQVSNEVPGLIAYGYIGRAILPGSFLLGFKGFETENPGSTIPQFLRELGRDFRGVFFRQCTVAGEFTIPCLTGPFSDRRDVLNEFALQNDILEENGQKAGLALGQTLGAFTENMMLLRRDIVRELRALTRSDLPRCC